MNNNEHSEVINEDELYLQATQEVDEGNQDKALWARCMALCEGDEGKAKYKYIKERVDRLRDVKVREIKEKRNEELAQKIKEERSKLKYYVENKELLKQFLAQHNYEVGKIHGATCITDNKGDVYAFIKDEDLLEYLTKIFPNFEGIEQH